MASIGEIVRLVMHYTQPAGGDMQNVFHFTINGVAPDDEDLLGDMLVYAVDIWYPEWAPLASTECQLTHITVDIVAADGTVTRNIGGEIVDENGSSGSSVLPPGNSAYLLAYTAIPKARGSKYVPGLSEGVVAEGKLSVLALADLATLLVPYITAYVAGSGATYQPGLLSKALETFVPFLVSGAIEQAIAYQRRRKAGVGV